MQIAYLCAAMAKKKSSKSEQTNNKKNTQDIIVHGARMHNLKNVTVSFPRNQLIVVTGVSGSGKSSLTMDTLFAEGQRRYAESLSSYARQFLMRMDKPDVDYIEGISPAIAIEQKVSAKSPRSTVGSITELQDYLRLLFARAGITYSPISNTEVKKDSVSDVVDVLLQLGEDSKALILAPFSLYQNRTVQEEINILMQKGFVRLYWEDGNGYEATHILRMENLLTDEHWMNKIEQSLQGKSKEKIFLLIDRVSIQANMDEDEIHRISDSVQTSFYEGQGQCQILTIEAENSRLLSFNNLFEADGIIFEEPSPNFFSFNNPYGACPACEGYGNILGLDLDLVIPNHQLSVYEDAVQAWKGEKMQEWKNDFIRESIVTKFPIHRPIYKLSKDELELLHQWIYKFFEMVETNLYKIQYRIIQSRYRGKTICPECKGGRLRKEALYVKIDGADISQLSNMPIKDLQQWFEHVKLSPYQEKIARRILIEIKTRIQTLMDVGLSYLTLNRTANTLSGGESQRIQLTRFLGSNLTDSIYILDEPSIGLHPRDTARLIKVLKNLRDLHNTVIVVEHDEMMMQEANHIIDMGPLAAHLGGEVVAQGSPKTLQENPKSLTGQYLKGKLKIELPKRKSISYKAAPKIKLTGCRQHNLKNIDIAFPLQMLTVVSGVSGSGKTTLVKNTLYPALMRHFNQTVDKPGLYDNMEGDLNEIDVVEMIDQNPIGKSSRSNPVTYIKAYDEIRQLFARQKAAKISGLEPRHFSFNTDGGRCDTCKGEGTITVAMQFLADVHLECDVCKGKRFKDIVLEVKYRERNIHDVLMMSVDEAIAFFHEEKSLVQKLQPLSDVGLGYIQLGQSSSQLSGGEAQRVKLASYLGKGKDKEKVFFIFDEPTTGLHFHDINKLLKSFYALLEMGHSILVIEHNIDVIEHADWVIDIGPEGGVDGGNIVFEGTPADLKKCKASHTAKFLH